VSEIFRFLGALVHRFVSEKSWRGRNQGEETARSVRKKRMGVSIERQSADSERITDRIRESHYG